MPIAAVSVLIAIVMTLVAARLVRRERRRADARVAALAAEVWRGEGDAWPLHVKTVADETPPDVRSPVDTDVPRRRSRMAAAIALAVFVVGSGAALGVVLGGSASASRGAAAAPTPAPLELVALGHERDGNALAIHGIVRNPSGGVAVSNLSAVVFLFTRQGTFAASARAAIDNDDLAPGSESRFTVVVPSADDVARYRVSFRTDRGILPHVDRRAVATEGSR